MKEMYFEDIWTRNMFPKGHTYILYLYLIFWIHFT